MAKFVLHPYQPSSYISPRTYGPRVDIGISGWLGVWYRFCHVLFSIYHALVNLPRLTMHVTISYCHFLRSSTFLDNLKLLIVSFLQLAKLWLNEKVIKKGKAIFPFYNKWSVIFRNFSLLYTSLFEFGPLRL